MKDWIGLLLAFAFGFAVGITFSSLLFESRIRLYKEYIERRLAAINRLRFQSPATRGWHRLSFLKVIFSRHPRSRGDSNSIGDK
jgi:hypothetical protein